VYRTPLSFSFLLPAVAGGLLLSCGQPGTGRSSEAAFESLTSGYIQAWKDFYPERAASMGLKEYRDRAQDRSPPAVEAWASFNDSILTRIAGAPADLPLDLRVDLRLVRNQGRAELARWRGEGDGCSGPGSSAESGGGVAPADTADPEAFRLGREAYEAELRRYYDMGITPEEVAERALEEIREVRRLMAETASAYW